MTGRAQTAQQPRTENQDTNPNNPIDTLKWRIVQGRVDYEELYGLILYAGDEIDPDSFLFKGGSISRYDAEKIAAGQFPADVSRRGIYENFRNMLKQEGLIQ